MTENFKVLNLGCGTKICSDADVINIDWSIYLRIKESAIANKLASYILKGERKQRYLALPDNVLVHNLAKGIPFEDESVDVVYHSHMLEHLDKEIVPVFLKEVKRVLKPGGVTRIVVPDLEFLCEAYLHHIKACDNPLEVKEHNNYVAEILEQCVRRESYGSSQQPAVRRFIENLLLGDARKRGETHQWMYDRINLSDALSEAGFRDMNVCQYNTSEISRWADYKLDVDQSGAQYKPGSLYIEAKK